MIITCMQGSLDKPLTCPMCRAPWGAFTWRPPPPLAKPSNAQSSASTVKNCGGSGRTCSVCRQVGIHHCWHFGQKCLCKVRVVLSDLSAPLHVKLTHRVKHAILHSYYRLNIHVAYAASSNAQSAGRRPTCNFIEQVRVLTALHFVLSPRPCRNH